MNPDLRPPSAPRRVLAGMLLCACAAVLLASGACARRAGESRPPGIVLSGEREALAALSGRLGPVEGSALARVAATALGKAEGCTAFEGSGPDLDAALASIRCRDGGGGEPRLRLEYRDAGGGWASAAIDVGSDASRVSVVIEAGGGLGGALPLLASSSPPGDPILGGSDLLAHLRVDADRRLADSLRSVIGEGPGRQLLVTGLLDGVWELAIYPPEPGGTMPGAALALGIRSSEAASKALSTLVAEVTHRWPIYATGTPGGQCLGNMAVLPGLQPCYAVDGDAVILAWEPRSLERARSRGRDAELPAAGGAVVHLDRIGEADRQLSPANRGVHPWSRLTLEGVSEDDVYRLEVELTS